MNPDWLSQLAPEHAPPAPGWWPLAPGWWALLGLIVALAVAFLCWRRWWRDPHAKVRRTALRELRAIRASDADGPVVARAIESLMRRYAMTVFGRQRVSRLTGRSWLGFVTSEAGVSQSAGETLLAAAFGNSPHDRRDEWLAAADAFVRRSARTRRGRSAA
ncbi:MAG TPA: DUF4381 domain-containing protein [Steroidobacteraceae bacterium]|jgi:hypothetical protein|nr:DUF4381 domain-containing protein [Steroidobacteraceae bacterium]